MTGFTRLVELLLLIGSLREPLATILALAALVLGTLIGIAVVVTAAKGRTSIEIRTGRPHGPP